MQDIIERRIGQLTIRIDRLLCVGFGDCIDAAAQAFEFDADGIVRFKDTAETVAREQLVQACATCPVDALTVLDDAGLQLVP